MILSTFGEVTIAFTLSLVGITCTYFVSCRNTIRLHCLLQEQQLPRYLTRTTFPITPITIQHSDIRPRLCYYQSSCRINCLLITTEKIREKKPDSFSTLVFRRFLSSTLSDRVSFCEFIWDRVYLQTYVGSCIYVCTYRTVYFCVDQSYRVFRDPSIGLCLSVSIYRKVYFFVSTRRTVSVCVFTNRTVSFRVHLSNRVFLRPPIGLCLSVSIYRKCIFMSTRLTVSFCVCTNICNQTVSFCVHLWYRLFLGAPMGPRLSLCLWIGPSICSHHNYELKLYCP